MSLYSVHNDEYLVSLLTKDDENAFNEIYLRYWQKLCAVAVHRIGDHFEAQEIMHTPLVTTL